MGNFKGDYTYPIKLIGNITAYQGNKVGSNNWLNKLYKRVYELGTTENSWEEPVRIQLISDDRQLKDLLERVKGDITVSSVEFPMNDVPPMPKCNGDFNPYTGIITHEKVCELPVHQEGVQLSWVS